MKKIIVLFALILVAAQVSAYTSVKLERPGDTGKMSIWYDDYGIDVKELYDEINLGLAKYKQNPLSMQERFYFQIIAYYSPSWGKGELHKAAGRTLGSLVVHRNIEQVLVREIGEGRSRYVQFTAVGSETIGPSDSDFDFVRVELRNSGDTAQIPVPDGYYVNARTLEKWSRDRLTWLRNKTADRIELQIFAFKKQGCCDKYIGLLYIYKNIGNVLVYEITIAGRKYLRFIASEYEWKPPQPKCGQEWERKCEWRNNSWYAVEVDKHCWWYKVYIKCPGYCYNGECTPASIEPYAPEPQPPQTAPQTSFKSNSVYAGKTVFKRIPTGTIYYRRVASNAQKAGSDYRRSPGNYYPSPFSHYRR